MTDDDDVVRWAKEQAITAAGGTIRHPAQVRLAAVLRDLGLEELAQVVDAGKICCAENPFDSLPPCLLEVADHAGKLHHTNWSDELGLHSMEWDDEGIEALRRLA